jgi:hypothetical protein
MATSRGFIGDRLYRPKLSLDSTEAGIAETAQNPVEFRTYQAQALDLSNRVDL